MPTTTILKNASQLVYQPQLFSELIKTMDESALAEVKSSLITAAKNSVKTKNADRKKYSELLNHTTG